MRSPECKMSIVTGTKNPDGSKNFDGTCGTCLEAFHQNRLPMATTYEEATDLLDAFAEAACPILYEDTMKMLKSRSDD